MGRLGLWFDRPPFVQLACMIVSLTLDYCHHDHDIRPPAHTAALYRDVEAAEKQCKELEKVVALVENNRQRFRHIDNVRAYVPASCIVE